MEHMVFYLEGLITSTHNLIQTKRDVVKMYEDEGTYPKPPADVIQSVRESINPLLIRLEWLESKLEEVKKSL